MTALKQYLRLEAPGLWRAQPEAQRLNVIVSIGDATLTLTDSGDRVLSHWSLAAVRRLNPDETPALYAPSSRPEEPETLEISDGDMIGAIETVLRAIERSRPRAGRLRLYATLAGLVAVAAFAVFWVPGALVRHTASVLPPVTREVVGQRLMERLDRVTGRPCAAPRGRDALERLRQRVLGAQSTAEIVVVSSGIAWAQHLPGGVILVDRGLVEDYETPEVVAGFILAETQRAAAADPMLALLENAGPFATGRLLATGTLSDRVLDRYGEVVLTRPRAPVDAEALLARFAAARVRSTPYAFAVDQTGETTLTLIEADPMAGAEVAPLLDATAWADLQTICTD